MRKTKKELIKENEDLLLAIESMYGIIVAVAEPMIELVKACQRKVRD